MPTKRILCVADNENIRQLRPNMPGYSDLATMSVCAAGTRAGANTYPGKPDSSALVATGKRLRAGAHDTSLHPSAL